MSGNIQGTLYDLEEEALWRPWILRAWLTEVTRTALEVDTSTVDGILILFIYFFR